jgi:signal transduction histidine kinase
MLTSNPTHSRGRSFAVIFGLVAGIAGADYLCGPHVSLVLFYMVPITLSVAWLGWGTACVVSIISILARVGGDLAIGPYEYPMAVTWNRLVDLGVYFVVVWVLHALISVHRELERRVDERTRELQDAIATRQRLEAELLEAAAREREAVGRELHDDLCQHLLATALAAKVLGEQLAAVHPSAAHEAQRIVHYLEQSIAKTRGLARGLLLENIEPSRLGEELAELAAKGTESGIVCRFTQQGDPDVTSAGAAAQLFRIAQEALRNALRHAQPSRVDITLAGDASATFLTIEDNGRGLPPPAARGTGMGLQIMAHRAAIIGGMLSIVPTAGEGTRVICHLPRSAPA